MKKSLFVAMLAVLLVALMGGVAFAYIPSQTGYKPYAAGDPNPHNGFTTATQNCAVCHAVHNAAGSDSGGTSAELLLGSSVANACLACHVTGNTGWVVVYDNADTKYTDSGNFGHNEDDALCTDCHQVHSATDKMVASDQPGADYLSAKILATGEPFKATFAAGDTPADSVSKWCTRCHEDYYTQAYNGHASDLDNFASHVMTTAKTAGDGGYQNGAAAAAVRGTQIAKYPSDTCYACHNDAEINLAGEGGTPLAAPMPIDGSYTYAGNFPHSSPGFRFLYSAQDEANNARTNAVGSGWADDGGFTPNNHYEDGACLYCHANTTGDGSTGVHKSF